jgi:hypothetical protein
MKTKKSKRIFGMSQIQVIILAVMACFAFTIITGMTGLIVYNTSLSGQPISLQPFTPVPVLPTMTIVHPTKTPIQTTTTQPTFTKPPTATKLPTETITPTPTLWFQVNAQGFIPTEKEMPSGYKIDTGGSGSISGEHVIEEYMVTYTNNYPNDPRNKSGDPYLVVYISTIFDTVGSATSSYDAMDESWISDNFGKMFNVSSTPQTISPSPVALNINGIERATAYISDYNGVSVSGFFVFIKLQNHNGVFIIRTLCHAPYTDKQRALDSAKYFTSLFVPKLIR